MFKNRLTSRVAIVASVLIALAAITVTAAHWSGQAAGLDIFSDIFSQNDQSAVSKRSGSSRSISEILNPDGSLIQGIDGSFDASGFRMTYGDDGAPVFVPFGSGCADGWDDRFTFNGTNGTVSAVVVSGADIYIGGTFTAVFDTPANYIARWNGTTWSALGTGMNSDVFAIAVSGTDVYAGGTFSTAGGAAANRIARWNGTTWSALGTGMSNAVNAIAVSGTDVYAGGSFTTAGGTVANRIARWNGTTWSALGTGMDNTVLAIAVSGTDVYAGGGFTTAGGTGANYIARWNGTSWSALGTGINGPVYAIAVSGTDVYAGGDFATAGGTAANYIARWNGTTWSALGTGMNSTVTAIAVSGTDVYAGGYFSTAGGTAANYIARWNGTSWSALGTGMNSLVRAIAVSGTVVYAGGNFTTAGGTAANYIARWNGTTWSALGTGMDDRVSTIAVSGTDVYAGGYFTTAGGTAANSIARWNGTTWSALGTGMNSEVQAIAVSGTDVYAGGSFSTAGGTAANQIARWNGTTWSALGTGMNSTVFAIAVSGTNVYAGGNFTTAGGTAANSIARWNGTTWSALGTGMNNWVQAIAVSGTDVYAGGQFTTAGCRVSAYFGRYADPLPPTATNLSAAETYTEDTPLNLTDIVVSDPDSPNVTATLTLSTPAAGSLNTATSGAVTSTYVAGTGVWTASGAIANVNTLLAGLTFTPAANFNGSFTIATNVSDGALSVNGSKAMTGTPVNDAPTATNLSAAESYTEDTALNLTDIVVSDVDSASVTVTLTLSIPSAGSLNTATSGAVTSTYNAGTGVWTAAGALANVNTLLAGLTFTPAANFNGSFTIATNVSDGALSVSGSKAMTGTPVNDAPTATNLSAAESYTEDTALNLTDIVVSDVDSASVTVTLTLSIPSAGSLNTATSGAVTSTYNAGTGVWTAAGALANVNTLLAGVTFTPTANSNVSFTIATSVSDGVAAAITGSKAMTGIAVNDAPTATNLSAAESYTEDTALNLTDIVVSDVDSASVTVTLTLSIPSAGSLNTATSGAVTSTYNAGTGVWTAAGALANVNTLLAGVTFTPTANANASFTIATSVSDGVAAAITGSKAMTGIAVNDAPTATNLSAAETYTEDTALNLIDIVASDVDSSNITATLTLSNPSAGSLNTATSGAVTSTYVVGTGVWTASGAIANVNTLLAGVTFTPTANFNGSFAITTSVSDGVAAAITGSKAMTGVAVNDAPVLDASKSPIFVTETEDDPAPVGAVGTPVANLVDLIPPAGGLDNVADVDTGAVTGLAVVAADSSIGTWFFSTDSGASWTALGAVSATSARLLAADAGTRLYLQASPNFTGIVSSAITFRAWDQTSGTNGQLADPSTNGGTTAFSIATDTASLTITGVNDAPVLDASRSPQMTTELEDAAAPVGVVGTPIANLVDFSFPAGQLDNVSDPDFLAQLGLAVVGADTANGTWFYTTDGGTSWTALGSVSNTSARLLAAFPNNRLYFRPAADFSGPISAALTIRAWDLTTGTNGGVANTSPNGGTTAFSTASDTVSLMITPVNDAPSFTKGADQSVPQDTPAQTVTGWATAISAGPPDEGSQALDFIVSNDNNPLFAVQPAVASNGTLTYTPAAGATGMATVSVSLHDNGGTSPGVDTSAVQTFTIEVVSTCSSPQTVTNANDSGSGSLRKAVADLCTGGTITFGTGVVGPITLATEIVIGKNVTIQGPADRLVISGGGVTRIFTVTGTSSLTVDKLTLSGGNGAGAISNGNGGGIFVDGGTLALTNSTVSGNSAATGGGGGVYNVAGTMTVTNSTFSGNSSNAGGAIANIGTLTLVNATLSANSGGSSGGGIHNVGTANSKNSIIAGNTASGSPDFSGTLTSQGYNIIGTSTGTTVAGDTTGNQLNVNPLLAPLGYYGGPTYTHPLTSGSTAINPASSNGAPATDQRGAARVGTADIGAFELNNTPNSGTFVAPLPSGTLNVPYNFVIAPNNGAFTYTLTAGSLPPGITLQSTLFAPSNVIALTGTPTFTGTYNFTITANNGAASNATNYRMVVIGPTASDVSIAGRVLTGEGRGIRGARVTVTGNSLASPITVTTGVNGRYTIPGLTAGETYVVTVGARRFFFELPSRVITLTDNVADADFTGTTGNSRDQ